MDNFKSIQTAIEANRPGVLSQAGGFVCKKLSYTINGQVGALF
jgi:hypothetical protein